MKTKNEKEQKALSKLQKKNKALVRDYNKKLSYHLSKVGACFDLDINDNIILRTDTLKIEKLEKEMPEQTIAFLERIN